MNCSCFLLVSHLLQVMQKMGKSEQTKDEVYTEFVVNFNKQQVGVAMGVVSN